MHEMNHPQDEFGIYILTYPGDFHLSSVLIESLRYFNKDLPIMIIPGEGFDYEDHPFDVPIMDIPNGFWGKLCHQDRDFWAFQGPFKKFLYLDADIICTGSINNLISRVLSEAEKFIFVNVYFENQEHWEEIISNKIHPEHNNAQNWIPVGLGDAKLLSEFDPQYNPFKRAPFNSGIFASHRFAISEDDLKELHEREVKFYESVLKEPFTWRSDKLLYRDQGRLNYLVDRLGLRVLDLKPDGHDVWAGAMTTFEIDETLNHNAESKFIHWAGVPRPTPSIFCRWPLTHIRKYFKDEFRKYQGYDNFPQVPAYDLWRFFYKKCTPFPKQIIDLFNWSYLDLKRLIIVLRVRLKLKTRLEVLSPFSPYRSIQ